MQEDIKSELLPQIKEEKDEFVNQWTDLNSFIESHDFDGHENYDVYPGDGQYVTEEVTKPQIKKTKKKKNMPPYKCHICKKSLANASSLKTHLNSHTGMSTYICEVGVKI